MITRDPNKRLVLFHRDFRRFTGGHLKVWNYFNHVLSSPSHDARIAFTPESRWDETNPWIQLRSSCVGWDPKRADILFLAGGDWEAMDAEETKNFPKPILNLIQHPRHADPKDKLYQFLENRALRICVSQQVADSINATGRVNGPVFVIPNGIDIAGVPARKLPSDRAIDILICGLKAPDLARDVHAALAADDLKVTCLNEWTSRANYLARLNDARIVVTLPRPLEGFYLPALEAMACGAMLVCPDCVGNRDFCIDEKNCFMPNYGASAIAAAVRKALVQSDEQRNEMLENARKTVLEHSLERERRSFLEVLDGIDDRWKEMGTGS